MVLQESVRDIVPKPSVLSLFDIDPFRIGGTEAFARELSSQLDQLGWESVLCFTAQPPEPVRQYLQMANVHLDVLKNPSRFAWQPVRDFVRILRRYRPRIVHLNYTPLASPYPWIARLCSVDRVFHTDHWSRPAHYVPRRPPLWKRIAARSAISPITGVVCVSDYSYRCMTTLEVLPTGRMRRIYNSVDLSHDGATVGVGAPFRQKYLIPSDRRLVVQVSWIIPEKGILDFLEAARVVVAKVPDVHFVVVGEGPYRAQYTRQANEMGLGGRVTWTGVIIDPIAEGVYIAADVVCQLSHWQEVFGWTIAEAMACRRPLVATRVGGIPELVKDGETGFLAEPGDISLIAEKIVMLLADRNLREKIGQAGRKVAEVKFDLKTNVGELLRFYDIA